MEVIRETQFHPPCRSRGHVYNDVLISIGLDSSTNSSKESDRDRNQDPKQGFGIEGVSTPIRNSANNLIALGKHVFTPNQGRVWELRNKFHLRRK